MCGRLISPAQETQSMREIRLLRGRLPRKGGGLTGMRLINNLTFAVSRHSFVDVSHFYLKLFTFTFDNLDKIRL